MTTHSGTRASQQLAKNKRGRVKNSRVYFQIRATTTTNYNQNIKEETKRKSVIQLSNIHDQKTVLFLFCCLLVVCM